MDQYSRFHHDVVTANQTTRSVLGLTFLHKSFALEQHKMFLKEGLVLARALALLVRAQLRPGFPSSRVSPRLPPVLACLLL